MKDILDIGVWYDQASNVIREQVGVASQSLKIPTNPCVVLPLEYAGKWKRWGDELEDGKKKMLAAKHPFYFASLGDAELALIGSGFPWDTATISGKLRACGFSRMSLGFRKEFIAALREADLLGLHQRWAPVTEATARVLSMSGIPIPAPNAVEVHLLYKMMGDKSLFEYLAGKRVVLVGNTVDRLLPLLANPDYCAEYAPVIGPLGSMKVVDVYKTRSKATTIETAVSDGSWMDIDPLTEWLKKTEYDIALLGCGAMANLIGRRAKGFGRTTLDLGFVLEALLGNTQRTHRPILRDIQWPTWRW